MVVIDRNHLPSAFVFQRPSTATAAAAARIVIVASFKEPLFGKDLVRI